jgi:uncharacterized repeat protein (TIGR01451 family)
LELEELKNIKILFFLLMLVLNQILWAKGVLAGTEIQNSVDLTYEIGGISHNANSNVVIDRVDQVIDVQVVSSNVSHLVVTPGQTDQVLTFKITNIGNGQDTFTLNHEINGTNDFNINNPRIYIDTNNNSLFDIAVDTQASEITLDADAYANLFLVCDIPSGTFATGDISGNAISAASKIGGSGIPGTSYAGAGTGGSWAVDGMSGGKDKAFGIYEIVDLAPRLIKSASVATTDVFTGSIITYTINVQLIGTGTIDNFIAHDTIPAGTTYMAGSLKLDGNPLTDSVDSDIGSFDGSGINVNFGSVTQSVSGAFNKSITFQVIIN